MNTHNALAVTPVTYNNRRQSFPATRSLIDSKLLGESRIDEIFDYVPVTI